MHAEGREFARDAVAAVAKLSGEERAVVVLHLQEELSFAEISEAFGEPLDTVRSRYRRAIIKLRALLDEPNAPKVDPHA